MKKDLFIHQFYFARSRCCCSYRVHLSSRIEHTTNKRRVNCLNTAKGMGSEKGMVVVKGKRRRVRIWTQKVAMHLWISSTTALEAEGIWIVTLTIHDHTQTQPIPISEWRGRGGGGVWVAFVGVGGDGREMVMVYLCLCRSRLFLCLWYCTWCVFIWFWLFRWLCYRVVWEVNSDPSTQ